jgi:hypothetical protein
LSQWQRPGGRDAVRTAVRFPLKLAVHLMMEGGPVDATTMDVSANGILFTAARLPETGSLIEFTMEMPATVMGWDKDGLIHCKGRVVRHCQHGDELFAAAVIDQYFLKAT